jgi:hypothetical protein
MLDALLPVALILLPFINWPVAIILVRSSRRNPRILSLRERAWYAVFLSAWTTVYVAITLNAEMDYQFLDILDARTIVRLGVLAVGLFPLWWLWSYYTNRFH